MSVHGVVVHPTNAAPATSAGPSTTGNVTKTLGSSTCVYPCATSWSDRGVPHRGQYAVTLSSSNSRPRSNSVFRDHHTLSTYSVSMVQYGFDMSIQNPIRSDIRTQS